MQKIAAFSTLVHPPIFTADEMQKIEDAVRDLNADFQDKMDFRRKFLAAAAYYEARGAPKKNLAIVELRDHEQELKRTTTALEGVLEEEVMAYSVSAKETKTTPMQAVTKIRDFMFKWEQQRLWQQFTPDHFWRTAKLLRVLDPRSPIRYEVLKTTL